MHIFKNAVAALAALVVLSGAAVAQDDSGASLLDQLQGADPAEADRLERQIRMDWANSGSPTMDLLLKRGKDALEAGDVDTAIGHLSALTDHAPDFAEGWHTRAMAFFQEEEYGLALHDLEMTLALNPDHFGAIYGLAVVMESLDRVDDAYALYSRVLSLHPNHADAQAGHERLAVRANGIDI
ncbi:tetratricopeptide repeat protein [Pseudooceanicola sp. LIPI14-2-Ac024]|uniref:tetratricopeptide repeat protein n=1 Tax=Pseudooceanicola sp. LIPI14-2-Ac024 TaxID=3344875 RepID=UPI0035CFC3BA